MSNPERPVRILIVDEEETLSRVLGIALSLEGWEVSTAASGAEALAVHDEPDIVLVDMMLPDLRGTEVVEAMRAAGSRAAILFVTGRTEHEHRMAAFRAGADEYLTKPFALEALVDHLHGVVRRLGLAPSNRTVDDLVLDVDSGMAWRGGEWLSLTSLEFELLRELVERRGTRLGIGELLTAAAARGIRVPRDFIARMLERIVEAVNRVGRPLVFADEFGWRVA